MQHETTHGNRSLKIRLNWAIFYVILILETRFIIDILAATPSCVCVQEQAAKLCSMEVIHLVFFGETKLLEFEFCFPKFLRALNDPGSIAAVQK